MKKNHHYRTNYTFNWLRKFKKKKINIFSKISKILKRYHFIYMYWDTLPVTKISYFGVFLNSAAAYINIHPILFTDYISNHFKLIFQIPFVQLKFFPQAVYGFKSLQEFNSSKGFYSSRMYALAKHKFKRIEVPFVHYSQHTVWMPEHHFIFHAETR